MSNDPLARTVGLGLAGLAIVSIPGLAPLTAWQGFQIGAGVAGLLFPPTGPAQDTGRLSDIRASGASQGAPIPIIVGRYRLGCTIIWGSDVRERKRTSGGGKGQPKTTVREYRVDLLLLIGEEIKRVRRVWADAEVIYDDRPERPNYTSTPATDDGRRPIIPKWLDRDEIRIQLGTGTQEPDPIIQADKGVANTPAYLYRSTIRFADFPIHKTGYHIPAFNIEVETVDGGVVTIKDVVDRGLAAIDFPADRYDTSELAALSCEGFVFGSRDTLANHLDGLQMCKFFDFLEVDDQLVARKRGGAATFVIDPYHLGFGVPDPLEEEYEETVQQGAEIPRRIDLTYPSVKMDYQTFTQSASRETSPQDKKAQMTAPLVMGENEALTVATRNLHLAALRDKTVAVSLPWQYASVAPGDVGTMVYRGKTLEWVVTDQSAALFGPVGLTLMPEDRTVYSINATGAQVPPIVTGDVEDGGQPRLLVFDVPALTADDADARAGIYVVAASDGKISGADVRADAKLKLEDGTTDDDVVRITSDGTIGQLYGDLAAWTGPNVWDETSELKLEVLAGAAPLSASELDVLNGANAIVVGDEVIQYRDAFEDPDADVDDRKYILTGLLRGRRGTEWAARLGATTNTACALLDTGTVYRCEFQSTAVGQTRVFKMWEDGVKYEQGQGYGFPQAQSTETIVGNSRKPWSPANVASDVGSGANMVLTWRYRSRYGDELRDDTDEVRLGETAEKYDVEVVTAGGAVVRTASGLTSPTWTYTTGYQATDGVAPGDPVHVRVYQVSPLVGRGFPAYATL